MWNVGEAVVVDASRYSTVNLMRGRVIKVSPTGQVTVELRRPFDGEPYTERFKNGWQVGGDQWHKLRIVDPENVPALEAKQERQRLVRKAVDAMRQVGSMSPNLHTKAAILEALNAAIDAVENLPAA